MNILIADDHQIVREGLKRVLGEAGDVRTIGEAENAARVLEQVRSARWDVVVLDLHMPGKGGLETLKELKLLFPKLPVLILSMYPEEQFAVRVMRAGASGYLTKAGAASELVPALRKIHAGGRYISPSVAEKLAETLADVQGRALHEGLSDREFQVFKMIAGGLTVGAIADELSLSVKTISTYRTKILEKLHLRNNAEIVQYAVEHGIKN